VFIAFAAGRKVVRKLVLVAAAAVAETSPVARTVDTPWASADPGRRSESRRCSGSTVFVVIQIKITFIQDKCKGFAIKTVNFMN
jgi:hypothetical protein